MDRALAVAAFEEGVGSVADHLALVGAEVVSTTYPDLVFVARHPVSGRPCRFRIRYDDFDERPASIKVVGHDNEPLPFDDWPHGGYWNPENGGTLCVVGVREYFEHSSHRSEPWAAHRASRAFTVGRYVDIALSNLQLASYPARPT